MRIVSVASRFAGVALMLAAAMSVASCDTIGNPFEAVGGKRASPDEFAVLARKPLKMPRSASLPEPRLGEVSALEPDPNADAIAALMGGPVTQTQVPQSAGESALLSAANASQEQSEIRTVLSRESEAGGTSTRYEPPSVFDFFSDDGEQVSDKELIDPKAESQRLQVEGVSPTPVDPRADPEQTQSPIKDLPEDNKPLSAKQGT